MANVTSIPEAQTMGGPIQTLCMGCTDEKCDFKPMAMQRRPLGDEDILIDMKYCGICHTDLHTAAGHMAALGLKRYPCVPGHELSGVCTAVGKNVTLVKVGDQVGVGCMVDSCLKCAACKRGEEQMCAKQVGTYNAVDKCGRAVTYPVGGHTLGGTHTPSHTHTLHAGTSYDMIESHPALFATPPPLLPLSLTRFLCSVPHRVHN